uniref:Uncharacterized protein n=1 Tax=Cyanistes caeruleus TaxID=156563 RepID=A0A8C0UIW2_CYACU
VPIPGSVQKTRGCGTRGHGELGGGAGLTFGVTAPKGVFSLKDPVMPGMCPRPGPGGGAVTEPLSAIAQFTGSAFGSAAIWQYESLKSRVQTYFEEARADWMDKLRPQKRGDFRKQVNSWWNNLTEGQRTVTGLC